MGLFEKAKNITDTELRMVVAGGGDPSESLRRHILRLEESQRQLKSSHGFLERQRTWLENSAERKLSLAEEWEKRAVTAVKQDREGLARQALLRKKELLRSMSEDRGQLERLLPQLEEVEDQLCKLREKTLKARAVRARFSAEGEAGALEDEKGVRPPDVVKGSDPFFVGEPVLSDREREELDEELKDLKRRIELEEES